MHRASNSDNHQESFGSVLGQIHTPCGNKEPGVDNLPSVGRRRVGWKQYFVLLISDGDGDCIMQWQDVGGETKGFSDVRRLQK